MSDIMSAPNEREVKEMQLKKPENEGMNAIVTSMNDEIREQVHAGPAPCTNDGFLKAVL